MYIKHRQSGLYIELFHIFLYYSSDKKVNSENILFPSQVHLQASCQTTRRLRSWCSSWARSPYPVPLGARNIWTGTRPSTPRGEATVCLFVCLFLFFKRRKKNLRFGCNNDSQNSWIDLMHWRHVSITTTPCWGSRLVALRAHVLLAERIGAHPLSQCAHPGQLGGEACRGLPSECMLGDGARGVPRLTPNTTGAPFCDVICIWSIAIFFMRLKVLMLTTFLPPIFVGRRVFFPNSTEQIDKDQQNTRFICCMHGIDITAWINLDLYFSSHV